jgi:hypothetical protein
MGYSPKAEALRRCQATTRAGEPCRCWAIWGHPDQLCSTHAGRTAHNWERFMERHKAQFAAFQAGASYEQLVRMEIQHARYPPCHCRAYDWPHRPGGGLCQWPDEPDRCAVCDNDSAERFEEPDPEPFEEPNRYPPGVVPRRR